MSKILWRPSAQQVEAAAITRFRRIIEQRYDVELADYAALHRWSVEFRERFWGELWDFCGVIASQRAEQVLVDGERMPGAHWFPGARLNFAENLLRNRGDGLALIAQAEGRAGQRLSFAELYAQVSRMVAALRADGLKPGDRVVAYMPNIPETVVAMLATTAIGAVWCSGSPDFGVSGILDRFSQVEPIVLIAADGYFYTGNRHDSLDNLAAIRPALPSLKRVVVVPWTGAAADIGRIEDAQTLDDYLRPHAAGDIAFEQLPFEHPLYILFTSGTTGVPKCIVHGAGGTLLQHLKEHRLHTGLEPGDRLFYFTTCGWMMWNWLVSALASEATLLLYDGSPFHPDGNVLFDFTTRESANVFGTSAKFIDALRKAGLRPAMSHDLSALRTVLSTGSPLMPESFEYVYEHIKADVCLSSISGGTDIISCFALGNPMLPVYSGELQCVALGMQVEVWSDDGSPVIGEKGELVCVGAFPAMPLGFWNDDDGKRYHAAYFQRFPGVWCHGDYVTLNDHGGMVIYGRSDAVLNPGGVRIGTAEIYRQVEQLDEVLESLVIGQDWQDDVRLVLFVRLRDGLILDDALAQSIRERIRHHATPRHVPARILQVADIPRTKSGKIVELAVRDVVHGREVRNQQALANPEALAEYRDRPELES